MATPCPLCQRLALPDLRAESGLAVAFNDGFPVNPGHTLIVPRRHVEGFFELTAEEQAALWRLLSELKQRLDVLADRPGLLRDHHEHEAGAV